MSSSQMMLSASSSSVDGPGRKVFVGEVIGEFLEKEVLVETRYLAFERHLMTSQFVPGIAGLAS